MNAKTAHDWFVIILAAIVLTAILSGCTRKATPVPQAYDTQGRELFRPPDSGKKRVCSFDVEVAGEVRYGMALSGLTAGPYPVVMKVEREDTVINMVPVLFLPPEDLIDTVTLIDRPGFPDWVGILNEAKTKVAPAKGYWFAEWTKGPSARILQRYNCRIIEQ